ncbi:peptidylprolyl isomerase [Siccirubricoccus sp. KC 17139]|uniref:Parvulin-like PPIase n=1 Tax=Siccirubricoccus soli TaxID=2899147 RepID=A0ABT1D8K1_9PROT|nr:peptidylprolyl isomerase [Siccirubricoccus soli]MCO6418265.1 peptidylprolyl isomerase [Siccirubricoccus soli]MCP2684400.1 peptidylprolyl isomerase [Siccirubricoccus soli]
MSRHALLAPALLALLAAAPPAGAQMPPQPPQAAQANRIVAVVNGDVVSRADIIGRARLFALNAGIGVSPETLERMRPQVTRLIVDEKLRAQEIQRRRIPVSDAEVAEAVQDLERRNNLPAGGLRAQLAQVGVAPRLLYDQIRTQIGWGRVLRQQLGPDAEPTQAEVDEALRNIRARIGQPEYLVSEIFIPVDDPTTEPETRRFVEEVIRQLRAGTPFPVAATQFSQAQSALQGGDIGWVRKEEVDSEVGDLIERMPPGAISNPVRVPGGYQIVALRQKRESGRDIATLISIRQAFFPFAGTLDPNAPTQQQRDQVEKAQRLAATARSCDAVEQAARGGGSDRPADPGEIRLETVNPPQLRSLLAGLPSGRPAQPILTPEGVLVMMLCSREQRNLAETNAQQVKSQLLRDRVENLSRQLQRDLRRRGNIEMRS